MALTLRLSAEGEETLNRMAASLHVSKNAAVAQAIDFAAPRPSHPDFIPEAAQRLLVRYADLMDRLSRA
ncbi:CopG family transcriptional regulator [Naasia lichenicola]|uniref:CopG family transcriptional regulator n=1 Tax=Naasia lichenicola TaxID=2565933 RepID=A0A4V3WT78_9MICO|nr:CopG family transcriptional regulator [Naasia lichenicola]THG30807.1 CopG family transcriptional regulator [Naasia lichenicola]